MEAKGLSSAQLAAGSCFSIELEEGFVGKGFCRFFLHVLVLPPSYTGAPL